MRVLNLHHMTAHKDFRSDERVWGRSGGEVEGGGRGEAGIVAEAASEGEEA